MVKVYSWSFVRNKMTEVTVRKVYSQSFVRNKMTEVKVRKVYTSG